MTSSTHTKSAQQSSNTMAAIRELQPSVWRSLRSSLCGLAPVRMMRLPMCSVRSAYQPKLRTHKLCRGSSVAMKNRRGFRTADSHDTESGFYFVSQWDRCNLFTGFVSIGTGF
jgi:hypothetical protein